MSIAPPDPPSGPPPAPTPGVGRIGKAPETARDEVALTGTAPAGPLTHLPPDWSPPGTRRGADGFLVPEHFVDPSTRRSSLARRHERLLASAQRVRAVVMGEFKRGGIVPTAVDEDRMREMLGLPARCSTTSVVDVGSEAGA